MDDELQAKVNEHLPMAAAAHALEIDGLELKFKNNLHRRGKLAKEVGGTKAHYDSQY